MTWQPIWCSIRLCVVPWRAATARVVCSYWSRPLDANGLPCTISCLGSARIPERSYVGPFSGQFSRARVIPSYKSLPFTIWWKKTFSANLMVKNNIGGNKDIQFCSTLRVRKVKWEKIRMWDNPQNIYNQNSARRENFCKPTDFHSKFLC